MKGSTTIGYVKGIKIQIHWSFWIIVLWIIMSYYFKSGSLTNAFYGGFFVLSVFGCVVLHELAHALTAAKYGIKTKNIVLLPIGGIANLEKIPENPKQELVIAIAGPVSNIIIAFVLFLVTYIFNLFPEYNEIKQFAQTNQEFFSSKLILLNLIIANLFLAFFNFIPAFPMDGGRILRALLSMKFSRVSATQMAASIGKTLAIVFIFLGFFYNFWLVFTGLFIYLGANSEALQEENKVTLFGVKVKNAMMIKIPSFAESEPIVNVVNHIIQTQEKAFIIYDINYSTIKGTLTQTELIEGIKTFGEDAPIASIKNKNFITVHENEDLNEVYIKLLSNKQEIAPVVDKNNKVVGAIDIDNINEFLYIKLAKQSYQNKNRI
ncbi:MAG: site-2 protease family protein [Vicingaceae bacterium]